MKFERIFIRDYTDPEIKSILWGVSNGIWFDLGRWSNEHRLWIPTNSSGATQKCFHINAQADGKKYKLCYNCKGLKVVEISYGKMERNNIRKIITCPTCVGHGTLMKPQHQEEMKL